MDTQVVENYLVEVNKLCAENDASIRRLLIIGSIIGIAIAIIIICLNGSILLMTAFIIIIAAMCAYSVSKQLPRTTVNDFGIQYEHWFHKWFVAWNEIAQIKEIEPFPTRINSFAGGVVLRLKSGRERAMENWCRSTDAILQNRLEILRKGLRQNKWNSP